MSKSKDFNEVVDKGLEGVSVCSTKISTIENSKLYYRSYGLEDLVENSSFLESSFLLLKGFLPNSEEFEVWNKKLSKKLFLDKDLPFDKLPTKQVHPMAWFRTAISLLALKEEQNNDFSTDSSVFELACLNLIAKSPLLIAFFHRQRQDQAQIEPQPDRGLAWNFLYLLRGEEPSEEHVKILDTCLLLHADHDLNCSTFSARVTSSSLSDLYSAIVSAIGTLKGPLHGGANERVMKMLSRFSNIEDAEQFVNEALKKKQKIMGFGHRVYKTQDPRAVILKQMSQKITEQKGKKDLFLISQAMEQKIQKEKGLCANVDFYSASVYHCLDIPTDLFTPLFAMSRMPGWLAHIAEQYSKNRIYRPKSFWIGDKNKKWKPIHKR